MAELDSTKDSIGRVVPGDICSEIMSWLPAKEALRARSICRAFNASSRDDTFFFSQSRRANEDSGVFLRRHDGRFEMVFTDGSPGIPPESLQFLKGGHKRILGSRGGLVLFDTGSSSDPGRFYLYNPVRRGALHHIPRPDGASIRSVQTAGVAFVFSDDGDGGFLHYDLVCMTPTSEWSSDMVCWVYSSREQAWRLIGDSIYVGPRNIKFHSPVVSSVHGRDDVIYLASDCGRYQKQKPYIVAVDTETGASEILPLPEKVIAEYSNGDLENIEISAARGGRSTTLNMVSCCNSASSSEFTVWELVILKDPAASTWVWEQKGQVMSMAAMGLEPRRPVHGVCLVNGDMLAFTVEEDVYLHNLRDGDGGHVTTQESDA